MKNMLFWRILASPFVFAFGVFYMFALSLPLPFIPGLLLYSAFGVISFPVVFILKKGGANINYPEPFTEDFPEFSVSKNILIEHIVGLTFYVWFPFYFTWDYLKIGEVTI